MEDRGAWRAIVHGVAKNGTWLSNFNNNNNNKNNNGASTIWHWGQCRGRWVLSALENFAIQFGNKWHKVNNWRTVSKYHDKELNCILEFKEGTKCSKVEWVVAFLLAFYPSETSWWLQWMIILLMQMSVCASYMKIFTCSDFLSHDIESQSPRKW